MPERPAHPSSELILEQERMKKKAKVAHKEDPARVAQRLGAADPPGSSYRGVFAAGRRPPTNHAQGTKPSRPDAALGLGSTTGRRPFDARGMKDAVRALGSHQSFKHKMAILVRGGIMKACQIGESACDADYLLEHPPEQLASHGRGILATTTGRRLTY